MQRQTRKPWIARMLVLVLAVLAVALPSTVQAFEIRNEDEVIIPADERVNNGLVIRANRFVLDGTVSGEVTVQAREIVINGAVLGNLTAVAPVIQIDGRVQGTATLIGQTINVNGTLGSARLFGQEMVLGEQSRIERGALASGGNLTQQRGGRIGQTLMFSGLFTSLNGQIGAGDPPGLGMGSTQLVALFNGDQPPAWLAAPAAQRTPDAPDTETARARQGALPTWLLDVLRRFAGLLVFGGLLLWLLPRLLPHTAELLPQQPLASLGWGIVALPLLLFSPVILLFGAGLIVFSFDTLGMSDLTVMSLTASSIALVAQILLIITLVGYISILLVGYTLAHLYLQRTQDAAKRHTLLPMLLGAAVISIALYLPAIGAVISLFCTLFGLGTLWRLWRQHSARLLAPAPTSTPVANEVPA